MGKYARNVESEAKAVKCQGRYLRVHFKNTREAAMALKNKSLKQAERYLKNVINHTDAIPFRRFVGGPGRHPMAKHYGVSQCRWPEKSCRFLLDLLTNAQSNAELKGLDSERLVITHVQVNRAPKMRRRTYRAHGRINAYQASPSHVELIAEEADVAVAENQEEEAPTKKKVSQKKLKRERLRSGLRVAGE